MSSNTTAIADGSRATWASKTPVRVSWVVSASAPFHSTSMRWRSAGVSTSIWPIGRSGSATTAVSSRTRRPAMVSTVSRSNRSVAYSIRPAMPSGVPSSA